MLMLILKSFIANSRTNYTDNGLCTCRLATSEFPLPSDKKKSRKNRTQNKCANHTLVLCSLCNIVYK
jgi:hypothetical protein